MSDSVIAAANVLCWGTLVGVWVVAAVREHRRSTGGEVRAQVRGPLDAPLVTGAIVLSALVLTAGRDLGARYLSIAGPWIPLAGLVLLVGSTLFAIRARVELSDAWSIGPRAVHERGLRTTGPYAITRHPIYTGLVGMLLGSTLLAGVGQWIVLVTTGLIVAELKIRMEERLLLETFPDAYADYRRDVPRLVPGLRLPRRRR